MKARWVIGTVIVAGRECQEREGEYPNTDGVHVVPA